MHHSHKDVAAMTMGNEKMMRVFVLQTGMESPGKFLGGA
jgi:hypothetical protein